MENSRNSSLLHASMMLEMESLQNSVRGSIQVILYIRINHILTLIVFYYNISLLLVWLTDSLCIENPGKHGDEKGQPRSSVGKDLTYWLSACDLWYLIPSYTKVFVFLSRFVSCAGCGIRLNQFLIIACSSEPRHEKICLRYMRTTKAQISARMSAFVFAA